MINWGIIGCGDVTEVKSGPAFNKVPNSRLVAVMRRDAEKAADYAKRHNVSKWYSEACQLINDPGVNAIYVATPPLQHEEYTMAALKAGKPVYVEKPMTVNLDAAQRILEAVKENNKVSVAHYRRAQPMYIKIKELLDSQTIGAVKYVNLQCLQPALSPAALQDPAKKWRVDPAVGGGGGLFNDLAPHQLDLMLYFFGPIKTACGISANQAGLYAADDIVTGNIEFGNGVLFSGLWCFTVPEDEGKEVCEIVGSEGKISFSVFGEPMVFITKKGKTSRVQFETLQHVQQPMIERVVQYFLGKGENPSPAENGVEVMRIIDIFTLTNFKS
ncbi:MAG: oxidoreductase domain protein [Segetibacter sp.]|nr:oxidoreductase domain protein [Segetibacter sp.]